MTLVLQGIALNEQPMSQPLIGRFDERGGTLGRSDTVTFTLPDAERMISRIQAQILHRDDGYWIENVSAANPILHNGRPLSAGMRVMLRESDELRIGGYTLRAAFEEDETSATILRGRTVITHLGAGTEASPNSARSAPGPAPAATTLRAPQSSVSTPATSVQAGFSEETLAGLRAALEAALDRVNPVKLEGTLGPWSVFDSLRPARRKARLWELYREHFVSLRQAALEDFSRFLSDARQKSKEEANETQIRSFDASSPSRTNPRRPKPGG
jgi:predicted component of type VI protein secretion system